MTLDRVLSIVGRVFIGAGVLVFLFLAYQLWGTGFRESRSQDALRLEADDLFAAVAAAPATTVAPGRPADTAPPNTTPAPPPAPAGSAVAVIRIPKIGLQKAVVEGTDVNDLKRGPGHYSETPLPGQPGNAGIAGHRTTFGAPFNALGELTNGDEILTTTRQGTFVYKVIKTQIVTPETVSVLNQPADKKTALLTLTTCHPKFSAAKRLIITAQLAPGVSPAPAAPATPPTTAAKANGTATTVPTTLPAPDLAGEVLPSSTSKLPAILWGIATAIVGLAVWGLSVTWRRWPAYALGAAPFLITLFIFFENFARLLPENY